MVDYDVDNDTRDVLQDFIDNYYSSKFSTIKNYTITKYNSYIYKIDLKESSINTGKLSENTIQDFIVIQGNKLNINVYNEKDLNINWGKNGRK